MAVSCFDVGPAPFRATSGVSSLIDFMPPDSYEKQLLLFTMLVLKVEAQQLCRAYFQVNCWPERDRSGKALLHEGGGDPRVMPPFTRRFCVERRLLQQSSEHVEAPRREKNLTGGVLRDLTHITSYNSHYPYIQICICSSVAISNMIITHLEYWESCVSPPVVRRIWRRGNNNN